MTRLKLLTLPPSPYNIKVRLALKLKGLEYEAVECGLDDRQLVVKHSGQPLTPVLLDGERAIYDSFGILRYLDANFGGPKLFDETRERQREIQAWEDYSNQLGAAFGLVIGQAFRGEVDDEATQRSQALYLELPARLEAALEQQPYLMGERPNAADLSVAPFFKYALATTADYPDGVLGFAVARVSLDPRFPRTRAWAERVLAIDGVPVA